MTVLRAPGVNLDRWPTTWLTLAGFRYRQGSHPADVVSEYLLEPNHNPQLLSRVRDTARFNLRELTADPMASGEEPSPEHNPTPPPLKFDAQRRCMTRCQSDSDGDCNWAHCPQLRDNEPERTGRHCPLDVDEEPTSSDCRIDRSRRLPRHAANCRPAVSIPCRNATVGRGQ